MGEGREVSIFLELLEFSGHQAVSRKGCSRNVESGGDPRAAWSSLVTLLR